MRHNMNELLARYLREWATRLSTEHKEEYLWRLVAKDLSVHLGQLANGHLRLDIYNGTLMVLMQRGDGNWYGYDRKSGRLVTRTYPAIRGPIGSIAKWKRD